MDVVVFDEQRGAKNIGIDVKLVCCDVVAHLDSLCLSLNKRTVQGPVEVWRMLNQECLGELKDLALDLDGGQRLWLAEFPMVSL